MKSLKILVMDDEIYANDLNPAILAVERLRQDGHSVETTDRMSVVLNSLKSRHFDVYVLDIDMSAVVDELQDANGATIGKVLRQWSAFSNIVVFSARGEAPHWFASANYHFQGYVFKGDRGVDELSAHIAQLASQTVHMDFSLEKCALPRDLVIYRHESLPSTVLPWQRIRELCHRVFPDPVLHECTRLQEVQDALKTDPACVLLLHTMFRDQETTWADLDVILAVQPTPQVIIGVDSGAGGAPESNRGVILQLVNRHPFRLVDLTQSDCEVTLETSLAAARLWYARQEIFEYPTDFQDFVGHPLSAEDLEAIRMQDELFAEQEDGDEE